MGGPDAASFRMSGRRLPLLHDIGREYAFFAELQSCNFDVFRVDNPGCGSAIVPIAAVLIHGHD